MIHDLIAIIDEYWLLLLIGQYPNGPLGGLANTLILSALSIAIAFPFAILLAFARLSKYRVLRWPVTVLVYVTRGVPLLMLVLWSYFLVPLLTGADVPSFLTMLTTLVVYQGAFLSEIIRAGILALGQGQRDGEDAGRAVQGHGHGHDEVAEGPDRLAAEQPGLPLEGQRAVHVAGRPLGQQAGGVQLALAGGQQAAALEEVEVVLDEARHHHEGGVAHRGLAGLAGDRVHRFQG